MDDRSERVAAAIAAFGSGEIVVVRDDDDRENEGDLILAAVHATPEKLGFIVRHTSGIVCTPIPPATARRLQLQPMVADNTAPLSTAFTVSVDFRPGLTTGISAEERCNTVRAIANPNAGAEEFVRPGHVFPLVARDGGVLMRSGHTEAAVDLCRLAELTEVGVLAELVNDDGTVMRGPQVADFAGEHGLREVSVADLIACDRDRDLSPQKQRVGAEPAVKGGEHPSNRDDHSGRENHRQESVKRRHRPRAERTKHHAHQTLPAHKRRDDGGDQHECVDVIHHQRCDPSLLAQTESVEVRRTDDPTDNRPDAG